MPTTDPQVEAYIARAAEFAQPILRHLRALVHKGCPDVEEAIKWRMPCFLYKGMLCNMAAFKQHCAFGFWNRAVAGSDAPADKDAMGQFGRLTTLADLPKDAVILRHIKEAARLNDEGVGKRPVRRGPREEMTVPAELTAALKKNRAAAAAFEAFSPSHRREYVEWIAEAKTDATRARRVETTIDWLVEGKPRMWKYLPKAAAAPKAKATASARTPRTSASRARRA
jgi:uncharacterized protein YdeI (YjbR/CyaY-like superfamily)